jgi:hypothetical protein
MREILLDITWSLAKKIHYVFEVMPSDISEAFKHNALFESWRKMQEEKEEDLLVRIECQPRPTMTSVGLARLKSPEACIDQKLFMLGNVYDYVYKCVQRNGIVIKHRGVGMFICAEDFESTSLSDIAERMASPIVEPTARRVK